MKQPDISIIIPIYNSENVIGHCVSSILNQTFNNLEVILVNDGSTDKSLYVCEKLQRKDSRIHIINKNNEGRVCARRDGFLAATGRYIAFSDHDDYMPGMALESLYILAEKHNLDMAVGGYERVCDNWRIVKRKVIFEHSGEIVQKDDLYPFLFGGDIDFNDTIADLQWGRLYKREVIQKAVDIDIESVFPSSKKNYMHEDMYYNLAVIPHIEKAGIIEDTVYCQRYGGASTLNHFRPVVTDGGEYFDKRYQHFIEVNYEEGLPRTFFKYLWYLYQEVYQRIKLGISTKEEVSEIIKNELENRLIVKWAKENLPSQYCEIPKASHALKNDVDGVIDDAIMEFDKFKVQFKYGWMISSYQWIVDKIAKVTPN